MEEMQPDLLGLNQSVGGSPNNINLSNNLNSLAGRRVPSAATPYSQQQNTPMFGAMSAGNQMPRFSGMGGQQRAGGFGGPYGPIMPGYGGPAIPVPPTHYPIRPIQSPLMPYAKPVAPPNPSLVPGGAPGLPGGVPNRLHPGQQPGMLPSGYMPGFI